VQGSQVTPCRAPGPEQLEGGQAALEGGGANSQGRHVLVVSTKHTCLGVWDVLSWAPSDSCCASLCCKGLVGSAHRSPLVLPPVTQPGQTCRPPGQPPGETQAHTGQLLLHLGAGLRRMRRGHWR
jgi:hypothetical protein